MRRMKTDSLELLRRIVANLKCLFGGSAFLLIFLIAVCAPFISPFDPLEQHLLDTLRPPGFTNAAASTYLLGTDNLGRDVLSRLIHGSRISILIGVATVGVAGSVGVLLGIISGYYRRIVDELIMRLVDVTLSFPTILLALAIMAFLGFGLVNLIISLTVTRWLTFCRVVRATTLSLMGHDFIEAARAMGATDLRIMLREILPNCLAPILVIATFEMALVIIFEASLSFLGIGVEPGTPSWGGMLNEGRNYMMQNWWLATFPGAAIFVCVLSINLLGDGLRDTLDPRLKR